MRMHRGSSKGTRENRVPETLPLSAPPPPAPAITVVLEIVRGGGTSTRSVEVPSGAKIRDALRSAGLAAEGCAVLEGERPVPLDRPLGDSRRLTVVPTFSGG